MRPRARLLHTLGRDLISSEKVAVIELVKNSYDADASVVLVRLIGAPAGAEARLEVWDDGHGMDIQTITGAWLEIATPHRRKVRRSEAKQRRVLGEKGIGRLAAARLGREMLLTTRRAASDEVQLLIDWSLFEDEDLFLDEVEMAWDAGMPTVFINDGTADQTFEASNVDQWDSGHGTVVQLDGLTTTWTDKEIQELRTALSRLIPPLPDDQLVQMTPDFQVVLDLPEEFEHLSGPVASPEELTKSHYRLTGSVDDDGTASLVYHQMDGRVEEPISTHLLGKSGRPPKCGPVTMDLRVWDRDTPALTALFPEATVTEARRSITNVSGISIYRDGFRVLPFGERGDDWLGLDARRVQNPTLRLSNNQLLGHAFISADRNPELRDQSNREGLIESTAYDDLRAVVKGALELIESRRYTARRPQGDSAERGGLFSRFNLTTVRDAVRARHPDDRILSELVQAKDTELHASVQQVQEVISRFSRLATMGLLVDRVVHDGRTAVARLRNISRFGHRDLEKSESSSEEKLDLADKALRDTQIQADMLGTLFRRIEPFGGRRRGRPRVAPLMRIVEDGVAILEQDASEAGIALTIQGEDTPVMLDASEIQEIIVNLVSNAIFWTSRSNTEGFQPEVRVKVERISASAVTITVSDTGPGVSDDFRQFIFDPYFSLRPDGVGLGLAIVGTVVEDYYHGELELLDTGPLPGASFRATLRRRV